MRSEEFDKKIIDAADHHQPAYAEQSWVEMKKLLDVHLPEKKDDRRRVLFFLLLLLCLGGGIWLTASKPWKKQELASATKDSTPGSGLQEQSPASSAPVDAGKQGSNSNTVNAVPYAPSSPSSNDNRQQPTDQANPPIAGKNDPVLNRTNNTYTKSNNPAQPDKVSGQSNAKKDVAVNPGGGSKRKNARKNSTPPAMDPAVKNDNAVNKQSEPVPVSQETIKTPDEGKKATEPVLQLNVPDNNPVVSDVKPVEVSPATSAAAAEPKAEPLAEAKPKSRSPLKKSVGFAFTLSAGPDISAVGVGNFGKVQPVIGVGINVSYGRHFSLSTGYYSVRKIYKAEAADYKFPTRPYHYSYLYEIDGNCKVIEIPVTLNWAFNQKKKGNWFVSAGASSFLMKRETYDYMYKYPSGQVTTYTKQFGNKNQHIFSVVSLSGGYRYNLSKSVFVSAEPYVKIPLKGVGAGKLNLNSGGMLFTIGIKPF